MDVDLDGRTRTYGQVPVSRCLILGVYCFKVTSRHVSHTPFAICTQNFRCLSLFTLSITYIPSNTYIINYFRKSTDLVEYGRTSTSLHYKIEANGN
jgi:hypothetical protein